MTMILAYKLITLASTLSKTTKLNLTTTEDLLSQLQLIFLLLEMKKKTPKQRRLKLRKLAKSNGKPLAECQNNIQKYCYSYIVAIYDHLSHCHDMDK